MNLISLLILSSPLSNGVSTLLTPPSVFEREAAVSLGLGAALGLGAFLTAVAFLAGMPPGGEWTHYYI